MRKTQLIAISALFSIIFATFPSCAYASFDATNYSNDELVSIVAACNAELELRNDIKNVWVDENGLKIIFDGLGYSYFEDMDDLFFEIYVTVINGTQKKVSIRIDDLYIDGWQEDNRGDISLEANRNTREKFISDLYKTEIKTIEDLLAIGNIELFLVAYIDNDKYETKILLTNTSSLFKTELMKYY